MDILGEYEKQHPVAQMPIQQTAFSPQSEYGFFIRLVMRLSGGKIENGRQASMALLAVSAVILLISLFVFARAGGWFSSGPRNLNAPIAGPGNTQLNTIRQP